MSNKQKLELTWIGKETRPRLEPRILLPDPSKSYHARNRTSNKDIFDNRLIFGDNLLALKALEAEFAGKIKCVYIDPPYNTGSAFAQYEDGLEHSIWLGLMRDRLELLRQLLSNDGSCWVQLDDNEAHYCRVLMDEIFGRNNFVANIVWNKSYAVRSNAQFFSTAHEHILVYSKQRELFRPNVFRRTDKQESRYDNPDADARGTWQSVTMTISLVGGARGRQYAKTGKSDNIYKVTSPSGKEFLPPPNRCWSRNPEGFAALDADHRIWWGPNGDRAPRLKLFLAESNEGILPTTLWADGDVFGLNQQGIREIRSLGLPDFPTPKPERLMAKVLEIGSSPGDLVLDSFAGSGTTGAVAHKLGRRWIMVELGEHCNTHILPRMHKVIDGADSVGVTESAKWKGGGGFRYYRLAPSLLERDKWGNWVINKQYDAGMLAAAVCQLESFTYEPSDTLWWKHGFSSERDFIYVTTQSLSAEQLQGLSEEVGSKRTLLICCAAYRGKQDRFPNLTVKKIPKMVLAKCEWGHDDYSLNVENLPMAQREAAAPQAKQSSSNDGERKTGGQAELFTENKP
jgi:adenine-specific DNA-methyltransferase